MDELTNFSFSTKSAGNVWAAGYSLTQSPLQDKKQVCNVEKKLDSIICKIGYRIIGECSG
jgi:hypothetical protein